MEERLDAPAGVPNSCADLEVNVPVRVAAAAE
jgi:hypothetical protein